MKADKEGFLYPVVDVGMLIVVCVLKFVLL